MLEDKIEKLTASINTLIEVIQKQSKDSCCSSEPKAKSKPKKTKEVEKEKVETKAPEKTEEPTDLFEELKKAILAVAKQEGGRAKALEILKSYNAEKLPEVAEEDYAGLLSKLQNALEED